MVVTQSPLRANSTRLTLRTLTEPYQPYESEAARHQKTSGGARNRGPARAFHSLFPREGISVKWKEMSP
jgi:hypothetical protein